MGAFPYIGPPPPRSMAFGWDPGQAQVKKRFEARGFKVRIYPHTTPILDELKCCCGILPMCALRWGQNGLEKYRLAKQWEQFKIVLLFSLSFYYSAIIRMFSLNRRTAWTLWNVILKKVPEISRGRHDFEAKPDWPDTDPDNGWKKTGIETVCPTEPSSPSRATGFEMTIERASFNSKLNSRKISCTCTPAIFRKWPPRHRTLFAGPSTW